MLAMLFRVFAIGLLWMFGPLPSEACNEVRNGCVELTPPPSPGWFASWFQKAPAPRAATAPADPGFAPAQPEHSAKAPIEFETGLIAETAAKRVRTVDVNPDGSLTKTPPDPADGR